MAAALCALLVCLYLSVKAGDFAGPFFVWGSAGIALYVGLHFAARLPKEEINEADRKRSRHKLVLVFLIYYVAIGALFLLYHVLFQSPPRPPSTTYLPVLMFTAILSYIPFYLLSVRKIGLVWTSLMVPILFVLGMFLSGFFTIAWYDEVTSEAEMVESANVAQTTAHFLVIRNLELKPEYSQQWSQRSRQINTGTTDSHLVEWIGLVPISTGRTDTLFALWVELTAKTFIDGNLSAEEVDRLEQEFLQANRARLDNYTTDSIKFFLRTNHKSVLESLEYPLHPESVVLHPVKVSFEEYRRQSSRDYLWMLFLILPAFWGVSWVGKR